MESENAGGTEGMSERPEHEICLVNMPLSSIVRPSLALGLLKSILERDGISTKVAYANLWYVEFVGAQYQPMMMMPRTEECLVDWLFAPAAFPEHTPPVEPFLDMLFTNHPDLLEEEDDPRGRLLDLRARTPEFVDWTARRLLADRPKIVGCTSTFQQHVASLALLRRIRELEPGIVTMLGGANCETVMGKTTHERFPWVDLVVSGEADSIIAPLCHRILSSGADLPTTELPAHVFAPVHRRSGYPHVETGDGLPRGTTASLAALPPPNYDDYFFREIDEFLYREHLRPGIPYESSRGCWWGERSHCTFCGLNGGGMGFRSKGPAQVIEEIDGLVDRYGSRRIETVDNIIDMTYFDSVLPHFAASERKLTMFYETKANLKRAQIETFRRSGVSWIQPGIESLDSNILRLIGKGVSAYQNVQALKWCRQFGVFAFWNVIAGFPGEKDEWYEEMASWLPAIEHLQPGNFSQLRYDRYSPYFTSSESYGLELRPCRQYEAVYPLPPEAMRDQAYFFTEEGTRLHEQLANGERPGLTQVFAYLTRWREQWPDVPRLEWDRNVPGDVIIDERRCTTGDRHLVTPLHRAALDACDAAVPPSVVHRRLAAAVDADPGLVDQAIDDLKDKRLLLQLDGRLLSLVLDDPEEYPPRIEFPGGSFLWSPPRAKTLPGDAPSEAIAPGAEA